MAYLKINDTDFSMYVNELNIKNVFNYNAEVNAAGNTVVDLINSKKEVEVGIIPVDDKVMKSLQDILKNFAVTLTFRNPQTNTLTNINAIIPESNVEYYTIRTGNVSYKEFKLTFVEL